MRTPTKLVLLLVLVICAACSKKVTASKDFKAAMTESRTVLKEFTASFPSQETALQALRETDPAAAAQKIETEVVPLLARLAEALAKAHTTGASYLAAATDEDPAVMDKLRANVARIERQAEAASRVRDLYAAQAKQLRAGALSKDDILEFAKATSDAFMALAKS